VRLPLGSGIPNLSKTGFSTAGIALTSTTSTPSITLDAYCSGSPIDASLSISFFLILSINSSPAE